MKIEPQKFNINKKLPDVLLVGNGVLLSTAELNGLGGESWSEKLYALSNKKLSEKKKEELKDVPYSVQATIFGDSEDDERQSKYIEVFHTLKFTDNTLLKDLTSLPFDAILTTNYTYEIENCFLSEYSELKNKLKYVKTIERSSSKNCDTKYLLHTFNQFKNRPPIWHIHGESRRKSSIVLTHDEYSRLIHQLVAENKLNKNKYIDYENEVKYKSWLDYFLMSNLYIVGLGMDFSEFDLWWILNRRMREKAKKGKIVLFESTNMNISKKKALEALGVYVKHFSEIGESDYIGLYREATKYIKNELETTKGVL